MPTHIHQKPFAQYLEVVPRTPLIIKSVVVHCTLAIHHFYTLFHSIILILWAMIYRLEIGLQHIEEIKIICDNDDRVYSTFILISSCT